MDIDRYKQIIADFAAREINDPGCPEMWEHAQQVTETRFGYTYDGLVSMGQEFHEDGRVTVFPDVPLSEPENWDELSGNGKWVQAHESVDAWIASVNAEIDRWNTELAPFRKGA